MRTARGHFFTTLPAVFLLTLLALGVHGYHPYSEDGGLYVAGAEKLLNPRLFTHWPHFVTEHLRFSVFAPLLADLVRLTHASLAAVLLALYLLSTAALLLAGFRLAGYLTQEPTRRLGAMTLLACWLALPIAGTSLLLADPYVTARSLSTPLLVFSLCFALDALHGRPRRWFWCALTWLAAVVLHPLMAAYGLAALLLAGAASLKSPRRRLSGFAILACSALLAALLLQRFAPAEPPGYLALALTRYYWFPGQWHLYEQLGLIAPLLLLVFFLRQSDLHPAGRTVLRAAIALGLISLLVAIVFSRAGVTPYFVARLQPLRAFQTVYIVMIVALGSWAAGQLRSFSRPVALLVAGAVVSLLAGTMFYAAHETYAHSDQVEWPRMAPANAWEQAFLWIRTNTPADSRIALDAHYITRGSGEDAQYFRAIALRDTPPDYSKDGGVASLDPGLTSEWTTGEKATENLERDGDAERLRKLQPFGITWIVLQAASPTAWACPYRNATVKVCRLP